MALETEIVLYPPPVKTKIARAHNGYTIDLCVDAKTGPLRGQIMVTQETIDRVMHDSTFCTLLRKAADEVCKAQGITPRVMAEKAIAAGWYDAGDDIGADDAGWGFSFHIPNPVSIVKSVANKVSDTAHSALHTAIGQLPAPLQGPMLTAANLLKKATNPMEVAHIMQQATKIAGGIKIPGTSIPIASLSPLGAQAAVASQILGDSTAINALSQNAASLIQSLGDEHYDRVGALLVGAAAQAAVKTIQSDAEFAKRIGIPTLKVDPRLQDAAEALTTILRMAYIHDASALAKIDALKKKAMSGDKEARLLWVLASEISDKAWKQHRAAAATSHIIAQPAAKIKAGATILVGDGVGDGYGRAGYVPPALPLHAALQPSTVR